MIDSKQFRELIVKPVLEALGYWSQAAENLLVMIMAWESKGGTYLKQKEGPALGIYMMEPLTYWGIWKIYLDHQPEPFRDKFYMAFSADVDKYMFEHDPTHMVGNLKYATAMARIFFLRIEEPIPTGLYELSIYAKKYWNTEKGKAKSSDYLTAYYRFEGISP